MTIEKDIIKKAYEPYCREALHVQIRFFSIIGIAAIISIFTTQYILLLTSFFAITFEAINLRIPLLALLEQKNESYITETLIMTGIFDKWSINDRFFDSMVNSIYPKEMNFNRYVIHCKREDASAIKVYLSINGKNWKIINDNIERYGGWKRNITYGKYSKVVVGFNDKDDASYILRHRLNKYI